MPGPPRQAQAEMLTARQRYLLLRGSAWTGASVVLGLVFLLYTRPDLMVQLSNHFWACF